MSETSLGKILNPNEPRDAVHVATAPLEAAMNLSPATHIGIDSEGKASVNATKLGIVDPFLKQDVEAGQWFNMVLYPNTVTGMRHHWFHPAFATPAESEANEKAKSVRWLKEYAMKMNPYDGREDAAYERLMEGLRSGELFAHGTDLHGLWELDDAEDLKYHAQVVLGAQIDWSNFQFSCSC